MKCHVPKIELPRTLSARGLRASALRVSALGLTALALLFPLDARAQTDFWTAVEGPFGGATVRDVAELPGDALFAATTGGVFRAEGERWHTASTGLLTSDVRDLHVRADGTLLAATHGDGIYQWDGDAWQRLALAAQFTTSVTEAPSGRLIVATLSGIRYSDDGEAWFSASLDGIQATPRRVASGDTFVFAATNVGVFRSADEGTTWDFASFGMATFDVTALAAGPAGIVYAGVNGGSGGGSSGGTCTIYRSRGNANLWTCVEPVTDPVSVTSLLVDASGRVHAGGFRHVFTSIDEGNAWTARVVAPTTIGALAETAAGELVAGTTGAGMYKFTPATATWNPWQLGLFAPIRDILVLEDRAVAATEGGVFYTSDEGRTWQRFSAESPLLIDTRELAVDADGRLLAGTVSGVWRLLESGGAGTGVDGEGAWEFLGPAAGLRIGALTVGPGGRVWIGYHSGVQFMSPGGSWTVMPIQGDDGAFRDVGAIGVMENGSLIAGAAWDSWRLAAAQVPSTPSGAVMAPWSLVSTSELPWFDIQTMAVQGNRVLAGTRFSGVLETTDGGATWRQAAPGLGGQEDVQDMAFDRFGNPFIATFGSGVFQLSPFTRQWIPANTGLGPNLRIRSIAFDSAGNAWLGTVSGGLFAHLVTSVGVEDGADLPGAEQPSLSIWPNPARAHVNVALRGAVVSGGLAGGAPAPGADIEVYDALGRRVLSAPGAARLAGGQHAAYRLSTGHLAPGLYFVRIGSLTGRFLISR